MIEGPETPLKFRTVTFADIASSYLPQSDLLLLCQAEFPLRLGSQDNGHRDEWGVFLYVPDEDSLSDLLVECLRLGASKKFADMIHELAMQNIPYVRIHQDGYAVEEYTA